MIACKGSLNICAMTGLAERRPAIINFVDSLFSEENGIQGSVIQLLIVLYLCLCLCGCAPYLHMCIRVSVCALVSE